MEWFNYPGLELWKFLNLAIFTPRPFTFLRKQSTRALLARRERIQQELLPLKLNANRRWPKWQKPTIC